VREGDRVYTQLREEIVQWKLVPGEVLGEAELSKRLGVSRTPIREALRRLEGDKLIQIRPGRGATVTDISVSSVAQLFQMREAIETYAARLAARKGDSTVFGSILDQLTSVLKGLDPDHAPEDAYAEYREVARRLHGAIEEAAGNVYLSAALQNVADHQARLRQLTNRNPARMYHAVQENVEICQAILDKDGDLAAELTAAHIHNGLQGIIAVIIQDVTGDALVSPHPIPRPKITPEGPAGQ
jgi:DNA-binding GntR family transcriptional regulator